MMVAFSIGFLIVWFNGIHFYDKDEADIWLQNSDYYEKILILKRQMKEGKIKPGSIGEEMYNDFVKEHPSFEELIGE